MNKKLSDMVPPSRTIEEIVLDAFVIIEDLKQKHRHLIDKGEEDRAYWAELYMNIIKELMDVIKLKESHINYLNEQIASGRAVIELKEEIKRYRNLCYSHGIDPRKHVFY